MATAGPELAQAAGAAFKVMVIQCGWALTGSKTESRGGARAGLAGPPSVICGLRWSWCRLPVDCCSAPLRTSGAEGRNDHCEGSLSPALWALDVMALKMVLRW